MTGAMHRRAGTRQLGFTLLELLVVLAILALGAALVVPSLNRARWEGTARSAAYQLAANLRSARAAAQAANAEHVLTMDLARRQYWAEGVVGRQQLPRTVSVDLVVPPSERIGPTAARVRFLADGSSSGASFVLRDGKSTASISVDWLNGDVRIRSGP